MSDINIDIGLKKTDRKKIAEGLSGVLADSYTLFLKTQNYHWNVTGPHFGPLHDLFEEQYRELFDAIDEIAERIRTLGFRAPGTLKEFGDLASVKEQTGQPDAMEMVKNLAEANETVHKTLRSAFETADEAGDEGTADLMVERMQAHAKNIWMLRSHLV
ncbi:MAG TPA: Dps family protein [Balneolaceae bacterium]|nr:Dps family protein [Balneolaceae bacterium]